IVAAPVRGPSRHARMSVALRMRRRSQKPPRRPPLSFDDALRQYPYAFCCEAAEGGGIIVGISNWWGGSIGGMSKVGPWAAAIATEGGGSIGGIWNWGGG